MAVWPIAVLIARIIILIARGYTAVDATAKVAALSGVAFNRLWDRLPIRYK